MLKIAKDSSLTDVVSAQNPISTQHPIEGSQEVVQVYVFNDDSSKRYENVSVQVNDTDGADESDWIEFSENGSSYSSSLDLGNIDDTDGHLVYVRITTPQVADTQNKNDLQIQVEGTEFAV